MSEKGQSLMRAVSDGVEAVSEVWQKFREEGQYLGRTRWGAHAVGVTDRRGHAHVRILQQLAESGHASDSTAPAVPNLTNQRLVFDRPYPGQATPDSPESAALGALDELGKCLLALGGQDLVSLAFEFDSKVRTIIEGRQRERRAMAKSEFDRLTNEGREQLAAVRQLEGKRDDIRDELNRRIATRNSTAAALGRVKRDKPSDESFPTKQEIADWREKFETAKRAHEEAERSADELRGTLRVKTAELSLARRELNGLRQRRDAARMRAGLPRPSGADEPEGFQVSRR